MGAAPWFFSATRLLSMLVGDILRCNNFITNIFDSLCMLLNSDDSQPFDY